MNVKQAMEDVNTFVPIQYQVSTVRVTMVTSSQVINSVQVKKGLHNNCHEFW